MRWKYTVILFSWSLICRMAKGKHRPAPGAIRPDKVLHPQSRKVAKLHKKENRKFKVANTVSVGAKRLEILGEKLQWFHDNLALVTDEEEVTAFSKTMLLRYIMDDKKSLPVK